MAGLINKLRDRLDPGMLEPEDLLTEEDLFIDTGMYSYEEELLNIPIENPVADGYSYAPESEFTEESPEMSGSQELDLEQIGEALRQRAEKRARHSDMFQTKALEQNRNGGGNTGGGGYA